MVHRSIVLSVSPEQALGVAARAVETSGLEVTSVEQGPREIVARIRVGWYALDSKVRITCVELSGGATSVDVDVAFNRTMNINDWGKSRKWAETLIERIRALSDH